MAAELMLFTIVSERQGVTNRDARSSPQEALALASTLVQGGVEKVWVFDAQGAFVSAAALSELARKRAESTVAPAVTVSGTTDLLARDHELPVAYSGSAETAAGKASVDRKGPAPRNARVFRMATQRY